MKIKSLSGTGEAHKMRHYKSNSMGTQGLASLNKSPVSQPLQLQKLYQVVFIFDQGSQVVQWFLPLVNPGSIPGLEVSWTSG